MILFVKEKNISSQQTVKCLLIVPNAESALNEEAGKLLLEHYEDYSQRARMMTEIHAQVCINEFDHDFTVIICWTHFLDNAANIP